MSGLRHAREWVLIVLISVVLLLCLWLLRSFLVPIAWAVIIALASWPLYRRFGEHLPRQLGSNGRALLFTMLVTVLVLGPFGFAFVAIGSQAQAWAHEIATAETRGVSPPDWLIAVPLAGSWMVDQWSAVLGTPGGVTAWLQRADSAWLFGWAGSLGQFVLRHAMIITFTVLGLFFIYRGGEPLAGRITQLIHDKLGQRGDSYFWQATGTIRATVGGMVVVALVDGVLIGVAYAIAHAPSPQVWGAVTGLLAMIPFLAYFVVAAVALVLVATGAGTAAIGLFALTFPRFFVFQGSGIKPRSSAHAAS